MTKSSRYFAGLSPTSLRPHHSIADTPQDFAFFAGPTELRPLTATPIDTARAFYRQSDVGTTVLPDFQGGTLRINQANATDNNNYTVENFATNKIDAFGHSIVFNGNFSGAGPLEIADSVGGGTITVAGASVLGGTLTVDKGAMLQWGNGSPGYLLGGGLSAIDNGALVLNFGGGGGIIGSVPISGSGRLVLQAGSLTDSGASTYTGSTTIDSGAALVLSSGGSIAKSSVVADNGTFDISGTAAGTSIVRLTGSGLASLGAQTLTIANASGLFSGVLADGGVAGGTGGGLTIAGGTQILSGTNTFTGTTTIDAGATLQLGAGGTAGTVAGPIADNGLVRFDYSGPVTAGSVVSGSGNVEVAAGTLIETSISFVGAVTIDSGATLQWGNGGAAAFLLGSGNSVVDNGALVVDFGGGVIGSVPISGSGNVTIQLGTLSDSAVSTYTGSTTINSGAALDLFGTGSIANSSVVADNGTFDISGTTAGTSIIALTGSGAVNLGGQTLTIANASGLFSGALADGGSAGGTGGRLIVAGGTQTLTGTNTFTGATAINAAASLLLSGGGSIADSSLVADNGTFDISGATAGTSIVNLIGSGLVSLGGQTLTIGNAFGSFSGVLADGGAFGGTGGSLTIAGGEQTLTGTNTFTGTTTIDSGAILQLAAHGTVAGSIVDNGLVRFAYSGAVTVDNNLSGSGSVEVAAGTVVVTNASAVGGTVTIDSGATLQWGNGSGAFLVGGGNNVVDNGALVGDFGGSGIVGSAPISGSGKVTIQSGLLEDSGASTYTGSTTIASAGSLVLTSGGSIANSSLVADNGTFDISGTTAGTSIVALTGSGTVSLGGFALTITNASGTFSGVLADGGLSGGSGGSLTIAGGKQTLTGMSTFTGATTIDAGATLQLGAGGTTGTVAGSIADNGLVRFDYAGPVTVGNGFSGSGNVEVAGGTAVVTGNDFLGGTVMIDKGATLQWGNGGPAFMIGSGNGVADNGALVLNFGGGGVGLNAPISGSGKLTIQSGSLNDDGISTYTGSTTIDSGTELLLTGTGSIANSSVVADNGTFDISGTTAGTSIVALTGSGAANLGGQTLVITKAAGTFSGGLADGGAFSGTGGSLAIAGGTETLTGTNTFTGTTTIGAGATLQLGAGGTTGTVAGSIILAANATLNIVHSAGTSETLNLALEGNDVVAGGAGTEIFVLAPNNLDGTESLNGGIGAAIDQLIFSAAGTVAASAITEVSHIEKLVLANGTNAITLSDAMVGSADDNHLLTVVGGSGNDTVDASAVTTAGNSVHIVAGAGNDTLTGSTQADTLNGGVGDDTLNGGAGNDTLITGPGNDTVNGGAGNDIIQPASNFTASDRLDGGTGTDTLLLDGNYSGGVTFHATTLVNVEKIQLADGFSYKLTTVDATVAAGQTLTVDGTALSAGHSLTFDGSAETDGSLVLRGGAGDDTLTGGTQADTLNGGGGADFLTPGNGFDTVIYSHAADSTSVNYDTVHGFFFGHDKFDIPGTGTPVTGIDAAITAGALSTASFDSDLAAALSGHLHANHAELFTPDSGTLAHQTFLVIDLNGTAGYQANADLVIHLTGQVGTLTAGDFI